MYKDIINELSVRYKEMVQEFRSIQDIVNDIDFVFDYNEDEQHLFYKLRAASEDHCNAVLKLIRFLKVQEQSSQVCDDPIATKQPVYDPNESQPVDQDDACCQARQCSRVDRDAAPAASSESLKDLLDMQVVAMGKGKCEGCPQDHYGTPCVKVELVGGYYICLAPTPNTVTE